jgi:CheY-like chemotaxis protein
VQMPGIDGIEATQRIRAAEAADELPPTPIVALSANAFAGHRDACREAGMDGFLVKPLDREHLAEWLDGRLKRASIAA